MSDSPQIPTKRLYLAGLPVDCLSKSEVFDVLSQRIEKQEQTFIMTPYSEFLHKILNDPECLPYLTKADINLADGIGLLVAERFLSKRFKTSNFYLRIFESLIQIFVTLLQAVLFRRTLYRNIPERISGSVFFWELNQWARDNNLSTFYLGGFNETPQRVSEIVKQKLPELNILGFSNSGGDDHGVIERLSHLKPDIVFVALGPFRQEQFILRVKDKVKSKIFIGVGGTFDYVAGNKVNPPGVIRSLGLEWLFRLITQPTRIKRIFNATYGMLIGLIRYKVFQSMPYRKNVMCVISWQGKILACKRQPLDPTGFGYSFEEHWQLPQGGIDKGESVEQTGLREVFEETGLSNIKLTHISPQTYSYTWFNGRRHLLGSSKYHFRGQEQVIAYFEVVGDPEVKLDGREFIDYKWVLPIELKNVVHPVRHESLDIALKYLSNK